MSELFNFFVEPFQLELLRRASSAAIVIAIV